jgi:hypothetical protein
MRCHGVGEWGVAWETMETDQNADRQCHALWLLELSWVSQGRNLARIPATGLIMAEAKLAPCGKTADLSSVSFPARPV